MKTLSWCIACLCIGWGAQAAEVCAGALEKEPAAVVPPSGVREEVLLVALPAELQPGGMVEVVYRLGGEVLFTERLAVGSEGVGEGAPVFELLAWHPEQRQTLLAEARPVQVDLALPGGGTWSIDLASLRVEAARFATIPVSPRTIHPVGPVAVEGQTAPEPALERIFAADITPQQCRDQCTQEQIWCEQGCGVAPAEDCLERCDYYHLECWEQCNNCPTVTDTTTTEFVGHQYVGPTHCLTDNWGIRGTKWYERMERTFKHTTTRKTVGCDGVSTYEVIAVWYTTDYCWRYSGVPCSFPIADRMNYCNY